MAHSTKKLINKVEDCVDESIAGFVALNPGLSTLSGQPRVIIRRDIEQYKNTGKVTTLTGGGSGHEPCFLGYVGEGMMSAAVHGALFASPAPNTILAALRALGRNHPAGVLVTFNNYTGDRLNFGIAVERARAEGIIIEILINADDCAVHTNDKTAGRRGLSGHVLLMKIVGHLAETGKSLMHIKEVATEAAVQIATMGVCWSPCSLPGGLPLFQLGPDEMELGLGMHGEAGAQRMKMQSAHDTVIKIINHMINKDNMSHLSIKKGDKVALLLNNLGSASDLEMNVVTHESIIYLEGVVGVKVERAYSSRFVTSQEMAGISITLMLLDDIRAGCLDATTKVASWVSPILPSQTSIRNTLLPLEFDANSGMMTDDGKQKRGPNLSKSDFEKLLAAVARACDALITSKDLLNQLDSGSGDGDCGSTLADGSNAIKKRLEMDELKNELSPCLLLMDLAQTVEQSMGGCSGALYSLFLTAGGQQMSLESNCRSNSWLHALKSGIEAITRYGCAEPGDRTMLDPLSAASKELDKISDTVDNIQSWQLAVKAAEEEAEKTKEMVARAGRSSYVSRDQLTRPDPGAKAVSIWMRAILDHFQSG